MNEAVTPLEAAMLAVTKFNGHDYYSAEIATAVIEALLERVDTLLVHDILDNYKDGVITLDVAGRLVLRAILGPPSEVEEEK